MKIYTSSDPHHVSSTGGKAFNLWKLKNVGVRVPDWVVIDQAELANALPQSLKSDLNAQSIQTFIDQIHLSDDLLKVIATRFDNAENKLFAVRSSGVSEDGALHSFAGQFESHLYVHFSDIPNYVKEVWKSNFSERLTAYLKANSLQPNFGIGVIIQEMIDPDVAGVAFGINPSTGEKNSKIICSVYGVGETLVSGQANADTYTLSGTKISEELAEKILAGKRGSSGKVILDPVRVEDQKKSSLSQTQILEIAALLDKLESHFGKPQDIEFAIYNQTLYLLQTRPITAVIHAPSQKNRIIWDNSNIVESYPGVTTPLTFSYILTAYKQVYLQLAEIMGASPKSLRENEATFANMLGLIQGRVYYNLLSWYKVLALFPGYRLNARFMENMMGVKERFDLPQQKQSSWLGAAFRTGLMISKIIYHAFTIRKTTKRFMDDVNREIDFFKKQDIEKLSAYELKELWIGLDHRLTRRWKAPLINDSFAMIYFGKLQKLVEKYKFTDNKNIQNDLLCGSQDIISVEPVHRSIEIASVIAQHHDLKRLFLEHEPSFIWRTLQDTNDTLILPLIQQYIDKFGERCVGELKLETISLKQDPTIFINTLKSFVLQGVTKASTASGMDLQLRTNAEKEVNEKLHFFKRRKLYKTLKKARYFVSNRENLRYERTRVFGLTREVFVQIGMRLQQMGVLAEHRDIFYLTKEEIFAFIDGTSVNQDLRKLVAIRKEEYTNYTKLDAPAERITTFETVYVGNQFYEQSSSILSGDLKGLGCCPGIVKARVQVIKHPSETASLNGDILVTSSTDPGWVTLFPTASAILVERGSLLSHSAIVSREMGIPCIVGVTGLLKTLKTGDIVEMNGSTGEIKRILDEQ